MTFTAAPGRPLPLAVALLACLLCVASHSSPVAGVFIDVGLNGTDWKLSNANGSISLPTGGSVPGSVHVDLFRAGVIGDPYYRYNERVYKWIVEDEPYWTYSKSFSLSVAALADSQLLWLTLDGIDTVANVSVNGHTVLSTFSQHLRYSVQLSHSILNLGLNTIAVTLFSPVVFAKQQSDRYPYTVPDSGQLGSFPHVNFVRKAQSDFGWDWGPAFAQLGVYRGIYLQSFSSPLIDSFHVQPLFQAGYSAASPYNRSAQHHESQPEEEEGQHDASVHDGFASYAEAERLTAAPVTLAINATIISPYAGATGRLLVALNGVVTLTVPLFLSAVGLNNIAVSTSVSNPQLWWPTGYGQPTLYSVTLSLQTLAQEDSSESYTTTEFASLHEIPATVQTRRIGLRTVQLVEQPYANETGLSFYFVINGIAVYAKGANWIPADSFHSRVTDSQLAFLLDSALAANMNMVRVWGGGIYQSRSFYDMCDERGLLVWQEMMFACAYYPVSQAFESLVSQEIVHQVTRLLSHPSVVIWGGNNEVEAALNWYTVPGVEKETYIVDYWQLFIDTIRSAVVSIDTSRPFVDSSPSKGVISEAPYAKRWGNVGDPTYGDIHFYDYGDDCQNVSIYPRARFVSEFGFQSYPSLLSWKNVSVPSDWSYESDLMAFRQRHGSGNDQLVAQLKRHFTVPAANSSVPATQQALFDSFCFLTQVQQALCYETAISHWRRIKSETGHTMGVLYWQLNDIWQGPSWSSIEWSGRWKSLHYFAKRFFAPFLVSSYVDSANELNVYITSDLPSAESGSLVIELRLYSTGAVKDTKSASFQVAALGSTKAYTSALTTLFKDSKCTVTTCFAQLTAFNVGASVNVTSYAYFASFASIGLPNPSFEILAVRLLSSNVAQVTFSSSALALFVTIESTAVDAGYFSDNGFTMLPSEEVQLTFTAASPLNLSVFEQSLQIRSLRSTF